MLHTKSQSQWPFGSREEKIQRVFTIYGHGGHVSHVTITICICFGGQLRLIIQTYFVLPYMGGGYFDQVT